jgi:large subunit ribosomal protein L25
MEKVLLNVQSRDVIGRKTGALRNDGKVPAVVYGAGRKSQNISVDNVQFVKTYRQTGSSSLVELDIDGKDRVPVLIQSFSKNPITNLVEHVDFLAVDMNKEVEAVIHLKFIGESLAVKALGGTMVTSIEKLTVKALPSALVPYIEIDISPLKEFGDSIRVRDIKLPEGVKIDESKLGQTIVSAAAPHVVDEAAEAATEMSPSDVAVVGEEEKKDEEGESAEDSEGPAKDSGKEKDKGADKGKEKGKEKGKDKK